jgi:enterochelin esterase family protein
MPLGYGFANLSEQAGDLLGPMGHAGWMEVFANSIESELVPAVEAEYSVRTEPDSRAVAGLSMGGVQALHLGLSRIGSFGWARSMSGAFMMYGKDIEPWLGRARGADPSELPDLWFLTGTEDFVLASNREVARWLEEVAVPHQYQEVSGAHTWMVWRRALIELIPRLFRPR